MDIICPCLHSWSTLEYAWYSQWELNLFSEWHFLEPLLHVVNCHLDQSQRHRSESIPGSVPLSCSAVSASVFWRSWCDRSLTCSYEHVYTRHGFLGRQNRSCWHPLLYLVLGRQHSRPSHTGRRQPHTPCTCHSSSFACSQPWVECSPWCMAPTRLPHSAEPDTSPPLCGPSHRLSVLNLVHSLRRSLSTQHHGGFHSPESAWPYSDAPVYQTCPSPPTNSQRIQTSFELGLTPCASNRAGLPWRFQAIHRCLSQWVSEAVTWRVLQAAMWGRSLWSCAGGGVKVLGYCYLAPF